MIAAESQPNCMELHTEGCVYAEREHRSGHLDYVTIHEDISTLRKQLTEQKKSPRIDLLDSASFKMLKMHAAALQQDDCVCLTNNGALSSSTYLLTYLLTY